MLSAQALAQPVPVCSQVISVIDSSTVICKETSKLRLAGLLPLETLSPNVDKQTLIRAKALLQALTLGKTISLSSATTEQDRHLRSIAQLYAGSRWVQSVLLSQGLAIIYADANDAPYLPEMLATEAKARKEKLGVWSNPAFRIHTPKSVKQKGFAIVEGVVTDVSSSKELMYLNFGSDWKSDFTISIKKSNLLHFKQAAYELSALKGKKVRVRGWVGMYNGPMIEVRYPEQLELREKLPAKVIAP